MSNRGSRHVSRGRKIGKAIRFYGRNITIACANTTTYSAAKPNDADRSVPYATVTAIGTIPTSSVHDLSGRFAQIERKGACSHSTALQVHRGLELLDEEVSCG